MTIVIAMDPHGVNVDVDVDVGNIIDDIIDNECAICQDVLRKPITLPCHHRYCSDCLDSWRCRHVLDKQKTCPECRSKIPVTKSMVAQLGSFRRLRADLQNKLNKSPCPLPALPGSVDYNYTKGFYGNIRDNEIVRIRNLSSPELQQNTLRSILESAHTHFDGQIRDLEEQIGADGIVLEEYTDNNCNCAKEQDRDEYELPPEIGVACENNDVERVLQWLGDCDPPVLSGRINAKKSKVHEMTLLHHATKGNRINLIRLLLQYGADMNAPTAMGLSPFLAACTSKRYQSIVMLFLEWGVDKESTAPGPPGVGDVTAIDIARNFAENEELLEVLKSPLGGRRCEIVAMETPTATAATTAATTTPTNLNGQACIVGKYFDATDEYAVTIGEHPTLIDGAAAGDDSNKQPKIKSKNLKRRDRTPEDPGVVLEFSGRDPGSNSMEWRTSKHVVSNNDTTSTNS